MQLILISILKKPKSNYGGDFYYLIFKNVEDKKPYKLTLQPKFNNFKHWQDVLKLEPGRLIYNVQTFGKVINGDSYPKIIPVKEMKNESMALQPSSETNANINQSESVQGVLKEGVPVSNNPCII